jgi:hypothetical protein
MRCFVIYLAQDRCSELHWIRLSCITYVSQLIGWKTRQKAPRVPSPVGEHHHQHVIQECDTWPGNLHP